MPTELEEFKEFLLELANESDEEWREYEWLDGWDFDPEVQIKKLTTVPEGVDRDWKQVKCEYNERMASIKYLFEQLQEEQKDLYNWSMENLDQKVLEPTLKHIESKSKKRKKSK